MIQDIAPKKLLNEYRPDAVPDDNSIVCFIQNGTIALLANHTGFASDKDAAAQNADSLPEFEALALPTWSDCCRSNSAPKDPTYLFSIDNTSWFLADRKASIPARCVSVKVRELRSIARSKEDDLVVFGAYTALQLANWYRDNRFCGTCGSKTVLGTKERSIICPDCGRTIYPRIIPAVIVGITDGDRLLHTRYAAGRGVRMYALVAGFTEIGETLEETVAREAYEEVGLRVKNIRYFKSQPWGIVDDILAGFYCDVDGSPEITLDREELKEAVWIPRDEIVGQPNDYSLTHHMMMTFRDGKEPKA
ncbi:MAG: NAD(+) diphosphatase [Lachnospiraceae bacterium]|nr:NAD(+) diphosphatase [Lachnospiraceae bacterium]